MPMGSVGILLFCTYMYIYMRVCENVYISEHDDALIANNSKQNVYCCYQHPLFLNVYVYTCVCVGTCIHQNVMMC